MPEIIKVKDAMNMLRLQPCTISVCTYDERRPEKSGKRITYIDCMLTGFTEPGVKHQEKPAEAKGKSKNPNFKATASTNIRCKNGDKVTIHPCLLESINGKPVAI